MLSTFIVITIALLFFGAKAGISINNWFKNKAIKKRFKAGAKAEIEAFKLLRERGYRVSKEQVARDGHFWVDGIKTAYKVRADFIASKGGRTYVVEVKSGKSAPNPNYLPTRRQLLEYEYVFRPEGLLLVDMSQGLIKLIEFDIKAEKKSINFILKAISLTATIFLLIGYHLGN